ncbi:hypothetical protein PLESTB_000905200 [Pleodorina starrii]|uniref:Uncharacterized protein n=1 Tax=Pleodorina starrii TaxID=330485 RepID=A0A9W6F3S8_9CHLO|nr:hypothetical protein PLESTB_000905200 [Pleodorina starrii]
MAGMLALGRAVGYAASKQAAWWLQPAIRSALPAFADAAAAHRAGGGLQARRGLATGNHPYYEMDKIKRTAEGRIDITGESGIAVPDEPGTGDMPHMTGSMPEMVEEEFRAPEAERVGAGIPPDLPDFYTGEAAPSARPTRSPPPGSGAATTSAQLDSSAHTGPHEGTQLHATGYGGPSQDYSHGAIPVVTDPMTGLASGSVAVADEATRRELGQAVIRGPGEEKVGVSSKQGQELEGM